MHRRDFLKAVGMTSIAAAVPLSGWVNAVRAARSPGTSFDGRLYRPGGHGRIEVSTDAGATWLLHSDLGADYVVQRLSADRKSGLKANVGFRDWTFGLTLAADRQKWLTS